jgi:hypothetical protein
MALVNHDDVEKVWWVFQEEQPRGLLGVIQFCCAAGFFPEHVIDVSESLFKHSGDLSKSSAYYGATQGVQSSRS